MVGLKAYFCYFKFRGPILKTKKALAQEIPDAEMKNSYAPRILGMLCYVMLCYVAQYPKGGGPYIGIEMSPTYPPLWGRVGPLFHWGRNVFRRKWGNRY